MLLLRSKYSATVIERMKLRNEGRKEMRWLEMDVLDLSFFPKDAFDLVVDKGVHQNPKTRLRVGTME